MNAYQVADLVNDVRAAVKQNPTATLLLERLKPLVLRVAAQPDWVKPEYYECNQSQGFGLHVLHEEPDHRLWLVAVAWLPRRGAPPHDHGTWAVIAGVDGVEKNILWHRRGGGLERSGEERVGPGDVTAFLPNGIHSVVNESERTTLSVHLYGKNVNFTDRSQFDPDTGAEKLFKVTVS